MISPQTLAALKDLELVARTVAAAAIQVAGLHRSTGKGAGIEFSQYRSYQPGDDLRRIDWKLYARSDRFYIRDSETETHTNVRILLDASASMAYQDNGIKKLDYARMLAASLAWLVGEQGDAVGLYLLQEQGIKAVPPQRSASHFGRIVYELEQVVPGGRFPDLQQHQAEFENWFGSAAHEITIIITDLHQHSDEISRFVEFLQSPRREMIVFQLLGQDEYEFNYRGSLIMEDLETGEQVRIDAAAARKHYLEALQAQLSAYRRDLADYQLFTMNEPLEVVLAHYLSVKK